MSKTYRLNLACLVFALLLSACAGKSHVSVPETQPGDQLETKYLVGNWCTNRELTSEANKDAGHSALTNVSKQFWNFKQDGTWQDSVSGWLFEDIGHWKLEGLNTLTLAPEEGKAKDYQANFKGDGANLYLEDADGKFIVLSGCE